MCNRGFKTSPPDPKNVEPEVKLIQRVIACENPYWVVSLDHITGSAEADVSNYIVLHPKIEHEYLVTGVCVLPIYQGKIGLVSHYRHPIEERLWEVPRGFIDSGENPVQAAMRELKEETGLICDIQHMTSLGYYLPEPSTMRARGALFAAESCYPDRRELRPELGLGELVLFPVEEVFQMISSSKIQDASSLITCYRYRDMLKLTTEICNEKI